MKTLPRSYLVRIRKNYFCILFSATAVYSKHVKLYFDFEAIAGDVVYMKKLTSERLLYNKRKTTSMKLGVFTTRIEKVKEVNSLRSYLDSGGLHLQLIGNCSKSRVIHLSVIFLFS